MQYRLDDRTANHLYLLSEDMQEVKHTNAGVQVRVPYCNEYAKDARFRQTWNGFLIVDLSVSQALEAISQDRAKDEKEKTFCDGCFDWGTFPTVPTGCARCALLSALRKGRHGDYRKAAGKQSPTTALPTTGQRSPLLCWLVLALVLATSGALCAWTRAASENQTLRQKMERIKP